MELIKSYLSSPITVLIIGGVVGSVIERLFKLSGWALPKIYTKASGRAKKILRFFRKNSILKIKKIRFHSCLINRELVKSYAYMILFWLSMLMWITSLILSPKPQNISQPNSYWLIVAALPVFYFEIIWLSRITFVSEIYSHRAKIKRNSHRLA